MANESIKKLEKSVIVSVQSAKSDPVCDCIRGMIKSVIKGGATGLRLAGAEHISQTREFSDIPIIGITKPDPLPVSRQEIVYITPTFRHAMQISEAGADIIAIDGTQRKRPEETLAELVYKIGHNLKKPVMADVSTIEEGLICDSLGVDIISTTLSGYTSYTLDKNNGEPDFELLRGLIKAVNCPVILEGRIWTPEHVSRAYETGAYAVVIGSAITRPDLLTRRFTGPS